MKLIFQSITSFVLLVTNCVAQQVPAVEVNIPYLVTFGKNGDKSWGDDDFSQTFFFVIPKYQKLPVYIRIFDPETSGANDEKKNRIQHKNAVFCVWWKNLFY
jgi:hypothetical protein